MCKIPSRFYVDIEKLAPKFIRQGTGPRIAKTTLTNKHKVQAIALLYIKAYCVTIIIKTV